MRHLVIIFLISICGGSSAQTIWCGSENHHVESKLIVAPEIVQRKVLVVPVVFHILWRDSSENISEERIRSQIDVLNTDFRGLNEEIKHLPENIRNLAADMEIEFCLASLDPSGGAANGITRKQTNIAAIGTQNTVTIPSRAFIKNESLGGTDAWDTDRYLNIWVGKFQPGSILAESKFPWDTLKPEDGIRIDPEYVGIHCVDAVKKNFSYGRTLTHEVGHYFGLLHPWSSDCNAGDMVDDTPPQRNAYYGCRVEENDLCGFQPLFENYMQFTDDLCMALFTKGQKARVDNMILNYRPELLMNNISCLPINYEETLSEENVNIFPNPSTGCIMIDLNLLRTKPVSIELFDSAGRLLHFVNSTAIGIRPLQIERIQSGVYFIRIKSEGDVVTKKVIVL